MTALFSHGQWRHDATVDEVVAEVTTNPAWDWAANPTSFISYCASASAHVGSTVQRRAFWREVGRRLCDIAGKPYGTMLE